MTISNDETLIQTERLALEEACRLAWNDQLDKEHKEEMVYKIIPGPKPATGRCCIYKEREIAYHRARFAYDKNLMENSDSKNEVQVTKLACDECLLLNCTVTDDRCLCFGKVCLSPYHFGTVTVGEFRSHINSKKCKERDMYMWNCPYGAIVYLVRPCKKACPIDAIIYDEYGFCVVDEQECIECGRCTHSYPLGVISAKSCLINVIQEVKAGKEIIATCVPATEGQFGEKVDMGLVRNVLKKIGSMDMVKVGPGGDMTVVYEVPKWSGTRKEGKKMTTPYYLIFINLLEKHSPQQYEENISMAISPMCVVSRYLKAMHPSCVTVFVDPYVTKKSEPADKSAPGNMDYVMTYDEFSAFLRSMGTQLEPEETGWQETSIFDERSATSSGAADAVLECVSECDEDVSEIKLLRCAGDAEYKKALQLLKFGRAVEDLIEGIVCPGGYVGGPSEHKTEVEIKRSRKTLLGRVDDRKALDGPKNYPMEKFSMYRDGHRGSEGLKRAEGEA